MYPNWLVERAQEEVDAWERACSDYGSMDQEHEVGNEMAATLREIIRQQNVARAQRKADARLGHANS